MARESARSHNGSSLDEFLEEVGIREEVESAATKRVVAWQLEREITERKPLMPQGADSVEDC